jgi:hypothetical protein
VAARQAALLRAPLGLLAALAIVAPAAAAPLTEATVRAFLVQQERHWNAGDLGAYYAGFRPEAVFVDQYRTPGGQIVPYGRATLAQARAQTRKFRATSKVAERGQVLRLTLAPDGQAADVVSRVTSRIEGPKAARTTCAERRQRLVLAAGRLRSTGQTDTFMPCGR